MFIKALGLWVLLIHSHPLYGIGFNPILEQALSEPLSSFFRGNEQHFQGAALDPHKSPGAAPIIFAHALSYPNLNVTCNARHDTAMFELPDSTAGRRGRPPKYGKRLMLDEIANDLTNYLCRMDNYFVAHRLVKTRIFGDHTVHAYVTLSKSGSYRLFFSTIDPMALHMSIAWQENKGLRNTSSKHMAIYPLKLYKLRWGIETNYYEQKMFWELGSYKVRTKTAIEHLLNLTNSGHALMKILPYEDERLNTYRDKSPQELRHALSQQIHKEVFFATLVSKAQSSINSSTLLKALQALAWGDEQAA